MFQSEFSKRIITAAILIPVVLFFTLWHNTTPFAAGVFIFAIVGSGELINMLSAAKQPVNKTYALTGAVIMSAGLQFAPHWAFFSLFICIFGLFLAKMFSEEPVENAVGFMTANTFGAVFFPFLFTFLWYIREMPYGGLWIIFLFCAVWMSDGFAYFVGRKIGKHKVVSKISPKKSLEGFIAGIIFGTGGSVAYYYIVLHAKAQLGFAQILLIAILVVISGILGDLFESMLKRSAGVKDSGNIIPGHGGVYDRVDALLFAAPVLYIFMKVWL